MPVLMLMGVMRYYTSNSLTSHAKIIGKLVLLNKSRLVFITKFNTQTMFFNFYFELYSEISRM